MKKVALILLVVGMWAQFSLLAFDNDIEVRGNVWNASQSFQTLALLFFVAWLSRSAAVRLVCVLLDVYAAMVAGCSVWWLVDHASFPSGEGQCSGRLNVPLFMLQMAAGLIILTQIVRGK